MTIETGTAAPLHFDGCHPDHAHADPDPGKTWEQLAETKVEPCWHCGAETTRGCRCEDCLMNDNEVPARAVFHCPTCRRWWAYMLPQVTRLDFGWE